MSPSNNFNSECIFLLGAGASADAGIPISTELNKKVRRQLLEEFNSDSKESELFNFLVGTILFHRGLKNSDPEKEKVNIEDVVTTLNILKEKEQEVLTAFVGSWHEKIRGFDDKFLKNFHSWLNGIVVGELNRITTNPDNATYLQWFVDLHEATKSPINIFTLNHDQALEIAFKESTIDFNLGFDKEGNWNPSLFEGQADKKGFPINIYKLHGSLGWRKEDDTGIITKEREFSIHDPHLMIFGILEKLTIEEPFFELIKQFKLKAREANLIVIIGYSFLDEYINEVLFESLREKKNKKVLVIDKNPTTIKKRIETTYKNRVNTSLINYLCKSEDSITENPEVGYGTKELFNKNILIDLIFKQLDLLRDTPF